MSRAPEGKPAPDDVTVVHVLYDERGCPTEDPSLAVRGEALEVDAYGRVLQVARRWVVDPKSLDGDLGELATRPRYRSERRHLSSGVAPGAAASQGRTRQRPGGSVAAGRAPSAAALAPARRR